MGPVVIISVAAPLVLQGINEYQAHGIRSDI